MTPACTIRDEETPSAMPVAYLHSHPFPLTPEQFDLFLCVMDFAFPRWERQFALKRDETDGCVVSKAPFATTHQITGAIKTFLVMHAESKNVSLPCGGEVR